MDDIIDLLQIKIEKAKNGLSDDTLNAINAVDWKAVILGMRERKGYSFEQLGDLELETELVLCGLLNPKNYPQELEKRMKIPKVAANELVEEMNRLVFVKIKEELIKNTERKKILGGEQIPGESERQFLENSPKTVLGKTALQNNTEEEEKSNAQVFREHGIEIIPARNASGIAVAGGNGNEKKALPVGLQPREAMPVPDLPAVPSAQQMQAGKLELKGEIAHPILAQKLSASVQIPSVKTEHSLENITKLARPHDSSGAGGTTSPTSYPKNADPYRLPPE